MIRKIAYFAILGVFVAAFAMAQTEVTTQQQPGATSETTVITKDGKVIATIEKVDLTGKSFIVKVDKTGETRTYTFNDKTTWEAKDKTFTVENLKTGDVVILESDPSNVVTRVKIRETTTTTVPPENNPEKQ